MSRLLGCAVVGAGRIGALHAQTLLALPNVRLAAVVDPDREAAIRAAEDRLVSTTLDAVFRNPEVDAVVIASPTELHAEQIVAAARAGKAIFCEKPVSFDLARAREALAVVEETQVPFQIGFQRRYDPGVVAARERLDEIGRLETIRMLSCPSPFRPGEVSGGIFCDMALHDIDLARFFAGEIGEVTAIGTSFAGEPSDDPDTTILTLRFASGAIGVIENARRTMHGCDVRAELTGRRGKFVIEREHDTSLRVYDEGGRHRDALDGFINRFRRAYIGEMEAFVRAVREGSRPSPGVADAMASLRVALAATRSLAAGRPVRVEEIEAEPATPRRKRKNA
jgi:myo-inositol 2-dehydrogenase/D-chiro-inositol 1-dehydrogenase